ncbi:MAG TPA: hypothetical protein VHB21_20260 [Minicystis sp.]|nr:hypothetical protein [Minicystis sp.]
MRNRWVAAGLALAIAALGVGCGGGRAQPPDQPLAVSGTTASATFQFAEAVHEVDVEACDGGCKVRDPYCGFGESTTIWDTGVGKEEWTFDDTEPRRHAATITGPIHYGVEPAGAGFSDVSDELREGHVYSVAATRYQTCDADTADCLAVEWEACAYFTVQGGQLVPY